MTRYVRLTRSATAVLCAMFTRAAIAQDTTRAAPPPPSLCYRGRPAPACTRFVITEIGYYRRVVGSRTTFTQPPLDGLPGYSFTNDDIGAQLTWEIGAMTNRGAHSALGATLVLGVGSEGARIGAKGRYRRWLAPDGSALDLGTGLVRGSYRSPQGGSIAASGVTADVMLNASDYIAVGTRVDVLHAAGRTASVLYGGVRLGYKPAIAGSILVAAGFLVLVSLLSRID